ncbi:MAG: SAM-dependent methyltransferase, partial [Pseudomonas sp.]
MSYLHSSQLLSRFKALDHFLVQHQALWKPRPFTTLQLDWEHQYPELASWLRQCTLEDAEANLDPNLPPAPYPQLAAQAQQLTALDELPDAGLSPAGHRLDVN